MATITENSIITRAKNIKCSCGCGLGRDHVIEQGICYREIVNGKCKVPNRRFERNGIAYWRLGGDVEPERTLEKWLYRNHGNGIWTRPKRPYYVTIA